MILSETLNKFMSLNRGIFPGEVCCPIQQRWNIEMFDMLELAF